MDPTTLLNFGHPMTEEQREQISAALEREIKVVDVPFQLDLNRSIPPQVRLIVSSIGFSPTKWQASPIIINPPGYAPGAAVLLAELHGRMGYFPPIVRLRREGSRFVLAEILDLQDVRDAARQAR